MIMRSFLISQFSYCPLVRMCHSRIVNNKISKHHEMALNIFDENKSASLQVFATEMYKVYSNVSNVVPNI